MEWRQTVLRASILQMWTEKKAQFGLSHVKEQKKQKKLQPQKRTWQHVPGLCRFQKQMCEKDPT